MEFGYTPNNLVELRKELGLTQRQVAEITGTKSWRITHQEAFPHNKKVK